MTEVLIPVGIPYSQVIEDFRAVLRNELQTLSPPRSADAPTEQGRQPRTVKEIAGKFGVCVATVWEWCRAGKFASHKIGGRTYFFEDEVLSALEGNQRTTKKGR